MVAQWAKLDGAKILVDGCGVGMYASQFLRRYSPNVEAMDIELPRVQDARDNGVLNAVASTAEELPYPANTFDTILSHEVIEHVRDDRAALAEMARVLRVGGRIVMFCPNRWYPFETHGHYWRGKYHFGNTPLINYLPDALRDRLAPHVRAYTKRGMHRMADGLPLKVVHHRRIYGGYDNIIARLGGAGKFIRDTLYRFEGTPLDVFGLSHLVVFEKV